jgi:hypothetical protein
LKEKIITQELAKLYEKQGYLEDSLSCYSELYEQTGNQKFADAIAKLEGQINTDKKSKPSDKYAAVLKKTLGDKAGTAENNDKENRAMSLFEQWVNMIVLEKKAQNFNENQAT